MFLKFCLRDVYAIAQLVGESGKVIGVDMTDEQLATANEFEEYHRQKFGYEKSNVSFKKGFENFFLIPFFSGYKKSCFSNFEKFEILF